MKAIVMAGGEGTRLRPVSFGCPKPMVRLLERPVLEHILSLLSRFDIRSVCTTLRHMPERIIKYFGDGSKFGVRLEHRIEDMPLGTAGGVAACRDFFGDEDFLVISGDAACDFDLSALIDSHKRNSPAITMALYPHPEPLPYGTVLTDSSGKVVRFIEKPQWERVITDLVNTGIYIVSPKAIELVPKGEQYDFAKDLFPLLIKRGMEIRGEALDGYWCDIGNPQAYLKCSMDALSGRLSVSPGAGMISENVWSASRIPHDTSIFPPCLIGEGVLIGSGASIGPFAVIGEGSVIGAQAHIANSVVDGAVVGAGARLDGAIVCHRATVRRGEKLSEGQVAAAPGSEAVPTATFRQPSVPRRLMDTARVLPCENRARLMRALSESLVEFGAEFDDGIRLGTEKGEVRISPAPDRSALVIEASSSSAEASEELTLEYEYMAKKLNERRS